MDKKEINLMVHIDRVPYKNKPKNNQIKTISNRITTTEIELTPKELANKIQDGYTILPSLMSGKRNKLNFKSCQAIFLDFDNSYKKDGVYYKIANYISFEKIQQNKFIQNHASFVYETHSSTEDINRYRVVFILDKAVQTEQEFSGIINYLLHKFPTADTSCKDVSRLFFSGINIVEINFNNTLSTHYCIPENNMNFNDYSKEIKNVDSLENISYKEKLSSLDFTNKYLFQPNLNKTYLTTMIMNREIINYRNAIMPNLDMDISHITSKKDMIYFINSLDLSILLGISNVNSFKCVLTEDTNPSASIYKVPDKNLYLYKRFGHDGFVLNVMDVFRVLLHTNSKDKVIDFFVRVFNLSYTIPRELYHSYKTIQYFLEHLNDINKLETTPSIKKVLGKHKILITDYILLILNTPYYDEQKNIVRYLSAKSAKTMANLLMGSTTNTKRNKINTLNNLLTYIGVFKKLDESEYPSTLKNYFKSYQLKNNNFKLQTVIEININKSLFSNDFIQLIEKNCEFLLERGFTFSGFTQDFITVVDSITESNKVYKQTQNKKVSKHYIDMLTELTEILDLHFMQNNQYILLSDVKNSIKSKFSRTAIDINFSKALNITMANLSLQKKKASKSIKAQFDIDADDFPYIIVRCN